MLDGALPAIVKEEDGALVVSSTQDVEPHMEYAKSCQRADAETRGRFGKRGDMRRSMAVPFNVILAVAQRLGIPHAKVFDSEHSKRIFAELKSPEFKVFRTTIDKNI